MPGIVVSGCAVETVAKHFDVVSYWKFIHDDTTLYEDYYVDAREVELTFPEEKRNLIYIFLESMEVTYASQNVGGAMKENYIPELSELALENIDFSEEEKMQGIITLTGADYTSGGIVAQTSAVPLNSSLVTGASVNKGLYSHNPMLPGAWTIGDVLYEEGYKQVFMIGSAGNFGGRSTYMQAHGNYEIWDYYTAIEKGKIDENYYVWWGYEDEKLISYAKEELLTLSRENKPFNFTMLTADTHFTDGYLCERCGNAYEDQYSNVIACSSRMIGEFIEWIQQQEFYENTTIVIVGDHPTMDSAYIEKNANDYSYDERMAYFTIINPAVGCEENEKPRLYSALDIYPTTLAALGVDIEGNRLGLGANLFSDEITLCEQYGIDYLNEELIKNSDFYVNELMK